MRLIVDTSIWSLALRRQPHIYNPDAENLKKIINNGENIFLLGIILQEILQGVKRPQEFISLKEYLDAFPLIEITREQYINAAELKNYLSRKGIQVSTIDALIATTAIEHDCYLYTNDKDFYYMARHSKLKLLKFI